MEIINNQLSTKKNRMQKNQMLFRSFPALTKIYVSNWIGSHQSLKCWILHKVVVQIPVGHHSVHLDTETMTEIQLQMEFLIVRKNICFVKVYFISYS